MVRTAHEPQRRCGHGRELGPGPYRDLWGHPRLGLAPEPLPDAQRRARGDRITEQRVAVRARERDHGGARGNWFSAGNVLRMQGSHLGGGAFPLAVAGHAHATRLR